MNKIIISINPKYVDKILDGSKKFELRTKIPKRDISSLIIYSTYPIKKVVAEVEVIEVLKLHPNKLWEIVKKDLSMNKKDYDLYYKDREIAYAYKLGIVNKFLEPKDLKYYGIDFAPQSFVYVDKK